MRVTLVMTHQCNLGCSYCYAGEKFRRSMPLEMGFQGLQMALRGPGEAQLAFFGGEPMLEFPNLARVVRAASQSSREVRLSITTNATILTERHLQFFRHYGFWVALSVDGLGETHDRYRPFVDGRPSSEVVWKNLGKAVDFLDEHKLHVLMVVSPGTVGGLLPAVERLYRMGYSRVSLLPNLEGDWAAHRDELAEAYGQLARITYLAQLTPEPLWLSPFMDHFEAPHSPLQDTVACGFGRTSVAISPKGNLYPCARLVGTDTRPEVQIGSLTQGVCSSRVEELRGHADDQLASCGGGCKCIPHMPGQVDPQLENHRLFNLITADACDAARQSCELVPA